MIIRARALVTGLAALAALALVVVGLPVVLYRFGGSPLPGQIGGWHRIAAVLASRDDGNLLVGVIRACSWLAWLLFTVCVLTEVQAAIRGSRAPHLQLGGLQGTAAYLVALTALAFTAPSGFTLSASAAVITQPGSASHPGPASQHGPFTRSGPSSDPGAAGLADAAGRPGQWSQAVELAPMTVSRQHASASTAGFLGVQKPMHADLDADGKMASRLVVVRAGDCLWSLAQRYLGDGDRYPEIASMNYGHEMGGGQVFTNPSLIDPGWQLLLPAPATAGSLPGGKRRRRAPRSPHRRPPLPPSAPGRARSRESDIRARSRCTGDSSHIGGRCARSQRSRTGCRSLRDGYRQRRGPVGHWG